VHDCCNAGVTSGRRVFSTNGGSTAFTRSIGDRDAGAVIISKPEINTVEVPVQVPLPLAPIFLLLHPCLIYPLHIHVGLVEIDCSRA
jgi:hypothetical protein